MTRTHDTNSDSPDVASLSSKQRAKLIANLPGDSNKELLTLGELRRRTDAVENPVTLAFEITTLEHTDPAGTSDDAILPRDPTGANLYTPDDEIATLPFVTITIAHEKTPFTIAGEPLTNERPLADVVDSLLTTARSHVDIGTVLADEQFNTSAVLETLDDNDVTYVVAHPRAKENQAAIDELDAHDADVGIRQNPPLEDDVQKTIDINQIFLPTDDVYTSFLTNKQPTADIGGWILQTYLKRLIAERQGARLKALVSHPDVETGAVACGGESTALYQLYCWVLANHRLQPSSPASPAHQQPLPFDTFVELLATGAPRNKQPLGDLASPANDHPQN